MAKLTVVEGELLGSSWELRRPINVIGRLEGCEIPIPNAHVSRKHARILENHGTYFIEDMQSRNSTYVNDKRLNGKTQLNDNDLISICDVKLQFHLTGSSALTFPDNSSIITPSNAWPPPKLIQQRPAGNSALPDIDNEPNRRDSRIPAIENGPGVIDASSILSSYSLTTGGFLRLLANPEAKLKALIDLSSNLSQLLTVESLLPKLLDCLMRSFLLADRAVILLNDLEQNQLQIRGIRLRDEESTDSPPLSATIIKYALLHKQVVLSDDVQGDSRFNSAESVAGLRIRSVMCAPLLSGTGQLLGVIQIDTANSQGRFITSDLELLVCLSNQASLAIDNAYLHKQAQAQRDLERELEFANSVQMGFLPTSRPDLKSFQFYDFYEPAQHVGGDFFDYVKLTDGRLAVTIGDVAGKGVPAALLMSRVYSMARYALLTSPTPAVAVTSLNKNIATSGLGHRFITLIMAVIDPETGVVTIVNAGHLPPLIRRADGTVETIPSHESGLPLGVTSDCTYQQSEVQVHPDDCVLLFTDGVTEAMNSRNEIYSLKRIREFLKTEQSSIDHLGEALVADVERFCEGRPQRDDICLVCFRRTTPEEDAAEAESHDQTTLPVNGRQVEN